MMTKDKALGYQEFIPHFREVVCRVVPRDAKALIISKGDAELLKLDDRVTGHFPQREDGAYPGYHPADSATAIAYLESLREKGAEYLVFPQTSFWWLEHYGEFRQHLQQHYSLLLHDEATCIIFALGETEKGPVGPMRDLNLSNPIAFQRFRHEFEADKRNVRDYLDPDLLKDLRVLFDFDYYFEQTGIAFSSLDDALGDYLERGCIEKVSPHVLFDPQFYFDHYPEARLSGAHPLLHFLTHSVTGLQNPGPYFDTEYYYSQNRELREKRTNALVHYLTHAAAGQAGNPNPLFANQYYLNNNRDVRDCKLNPLAHFVHDGCKEGRFASRVHYDIAAPLLRTSKHSLIRGKWTSGSVLLFSYGESPTSAAALIKLAETLERDYHVDCLVLVFKRQEMAAEFEKLPKVIVLQDFEMECNLFRPSALRLLVKSLSVLRPLFAVTEVQEILGGLKQSGITSFYLCPGFADRYPRHVLRRLIRQADHVLCPSDELLRSVTKAAGYDAIDGALRAYDELAPTCICKDAAIRKEAEMPHVIKASSIEGCVTSLLELTKRTLSLSDATWRPVKTTAAGLTKKVIIPCSDWSVSGVNSSLEAFSQELIGLGWDVRIVFTRDRDYVMESMKRDEHFPLLPHTFLQAMRPGVEGMWEALISHIECEAPTIMFMAYDFLGNSIAPAMTEKVGVISWVQSDESIYYEQTYRLGRYCNAVVCVSQRIKSTVAEQNPAIGERAYVIHNSSIWEHEIAEKKFVDSKKLRLVYTGRLVQYQKRILDFIDLANSLDSVGVPYELTLVGEFSGQENTQHLFQTKAKAHLQDGRIRLPGRSTRGQILDVLSDNDIFVLLSDFEGLPLSLVEAMARGCVPVVAEMESGIAEVIRSGDNGLIISGRNYNEWARAIVELWRSPKRQQRLSREARKTVRERFTVEHVAKQFDALFQQVAEEIRSGKYMRPPSLHAGIHRSPTGDVLPPLNLYPPLGKRLGFRE